MQYSDEAKTEFKLNTYNDKGTALSALKLINYRGGNTKTGITQTHPTAFSLDIITRYYPISNIISTDIILDIGGILDEMSWSYLTPKIRKNILYLI